MPLPELLATFALLWLCYALAVHAESPWAHKEHRPVEVQTSDASQADAKAAADEGTPNEVKRLRDRLHNLRQEGAVRPPRREPRWRADAAPEKQLKRHARLQAELEARERHEKLNHGDEL